jgi:hypothetical protein
MNITPESSVGVKRAAWRVYRSPDGSGQSYCGEYDSLESAQKAADSEPDGLHKYLWDTARAAGHCGGLHSPPSDGVEDDEPKSWHGKHGWHYVVRVRY